MKTPLSFKKFQLELEAYLQAKFRPQDKDLDIIIEAAGYSVLNGGKRLRGNLVLAVGELAGKRAQYLPLATAIEMYHAYSLIHDDLPALDNDALRRGKPSNHIVYGEALALLAGDYLFTYATQILSQIKGFKPENVLACMQYLTEALGTKGMMGGQVMDILAEKKSVDVTYLQKMHLYKTAALIRASVICPIILTEGDYPLELEQIVEGIGWLFQIVDDILDLTADEKKLGKPVKSDEKSQKSTYVSLLGLAEAQQMAQAVYEDLLAEIENIESCYVTLLSDLLTLVYFREA